MVQWISAAAAAHWFNAEKFIQICLFSVTGPFFVFVLWTFYANKEKPVVKRRGIWSSSFIILAFAISGFDIMLSAAVNLPCVVYLSILSLMSPTMVFFAIERAFLIYAFFVMTQEARLEERGGVEEEATHGAHEPIDNWIKAHRRVIHHRLRSRFKLAALFIVISCAVTIMFFALFYREKDNLVEGSFADIVFAPYHSDLCTYRIYLTWTRIICILFALAAIVILYLSKKLRKVQENFLLVWEMKQLVLMAILVMLLVILWLATSSVVLIQGRVVFHILCNIGLPFAAAVMILPIKQNQRLRSHSSAASMTENNTPVLISMSGHTKRTNSGKHEEAMMAKRDILTNFLTNEDMFPTFEAFLCLEFSVEEAYFWRSVHSLNKLFESGKSGEDRELQKRAVLRIFKRFCSDDAKFQINISSTCRNSIFEICKQLVDHHDHHQQSKLVDGALMYLQKAQAEIFELILHDSFVRFKKTKQFSQSMQKCVQNL